MALNENLFSGNSLNLQLLFLYRFYQKITFCRINLNTFEAPVPFADSSNFKLMNICSLGQVAISKRPKNLYFIPFDPFTTAHKRCILNTFMITFKVTVPLCYCPSFLVYSFVQAATTGSYRQLNNILLNHCTDEAMNAHNSFLPFGCFFDSLIPSKQLITFYDSS